MRGCAAVPNGEGRGPHRVNPRVGEEIAELLQRYIEHMAQTRASDRACCVATLLRYPGILVSARRGPGGKRVDEVLKPGSKRLGLPASMRHLLADAASFGLVLAHQRVATRPGGEATNRRDARHAPPQRARSLSDAVLTAEIMQHGRLTDAASADIRAQVVRQRTAQQLWDLAARQVLPGIGRPAAADTPLGLVAERQIQHELTTALPPLLDVDDDELAGREELIQRWDGSLAGRLLTIKEPHAS
jgi:hypothetical protein